jgi:hypothetical protein
MITRKNILFLTLLIVLFISIEGMGYYIGTKGLVHREKKDHQKTIKQSMTTLKLRNQYLKYRIQSLFPDGIYIVVDSGSNRLFLKRGNKVIREAVISCGSGNILKDPNGKRQWVFDTPRGMFTVQKKFTSPVWTKPDWAFIEDGEKIPTSWKDRVEERVLGNYALGFGNGYFIHGTLYTRLLGRNVTHGCIRVRDEDLITVFKAAEIGTKIFIF